MKKKYYIVLVLIISSLLVGCLKNENKEELKKEEEEEVSLDISQSHSIKEFDDNYAIFLDNEDCLIRTSKAEIIDNNALFSLSIENKSGSDLKISLDKVNLGHKEKEVDFEYIVKAKETKDGLLKIKDIGKIEELNDKMEGLFKVNSKEYYFVFK